MCGVSPRPEALRRNRRRGSTRDREARITWPSCVSTILHSMAPPPATPPAATPATASFEDELARLKTVSSAFYAPAILLSAIELDVFAALAHIGPADAASLSRTLHVNERALSALLS